MIHRNLVHLRTKWNFAHIFLQTKFLFSLKYHLNAWLKNRLCDIVEAVSMLEFFQISWEPRIVKQLHMDINDTICAQKV